MWQKKKIILSRLCGVSDAFVVAFMYYYSLFIIIFVNLKP